MIGLFHGVPGGRAWRRCLSETMHKPDAGPDLLLTALAFTEPGDRAAA